MRGQSSILIEVIYSVYFYLLAIFLFLGNARAEPSCEAKYPLANSYSFLLWFSAHDGDLVCAKEALAHGADMEFSRTLYTTDLGIGSRCLDTAVENNRPEMVRFLIEQGADVNAVNIHGLKSIDYAEHIEVAKILLENGARFPRPTYQTGFKFYLVPPWAMLVQTKNYPLLRYYMGLLSLDSSERNAMFSAVKNTPGTDRKEMLRFVAGWPNDLKSKKEQEKKLDRAWKDWEIWSRYGWIPGKYWPDPKEGYLLEALTTSFEGNKSVHAPFKKATQNVRAAYHNLNRARTAPEKLRASSLDVDKVSVPYYRLILQGAMTPEAVASGKFQPDKEQAFKVVGVLLSHEDAREAEFKAAEWLLGKAGVSLTTSLLDSLVLPLRETKEQMTLLLNTNPMKFQSVPNMMALKLTKVIMDSAGQKYNPAPLQWLTQYGDLSHADKNLFFSLARLIVEKAPLPPEDRRMALRAMAHWTKDSPGLRKDLIHLLGSTIGAVDPSKRPLQDTVQINQEVGLASDLSFSGWLAQIQAFSEIRAQRGGEGPLLTDYERHIAAGLLRYSLGQPEGIYEANGNKLKINSAEPHKGSLVKLCRLVKTEGQDPALVQGAQSWLDFLRGFLDWPRVMPVGLELKYSGKILPPDLRQEFKLQGLKTDLKALETNCKSVQIR